ncbi:MAG: FKBP-type peptidyl-prolyl cis-trans isomerase, partial [Pseudomonadota bacterium]|nr:FKBP-type peptidyl-prolyl cis-trans isomerase [Pseudomonadota bacterium]
LMSVGEKWRVFIHPDLAYGEEGRPPGIPSNSTLIFDIKLHDIKS